MVIVKHGLYNVFDDYFLQYGNRFFTDNKEENRPYYCVFTDVLNISWLIPLNSNVENYRTKSQKWEQQHKGGIYLYSYIGRIAGEEKVFLIGNMFPVTERYIKKEYTIGIQHYIVENKCQIKEIHKRASKYLSLAKTGIIKPSIDILGIATDLTAPIS